MTARVRSFGFHRKRPRSPCNAAERVLRHGVIWRRTSHGTDSESGSRYVERVLTVVATCRQRGLDVLGFLTECFRAGFEARMAPSLLS